MKDWKLFEDEVANLYRQLGYSVTANINVAGQQIDLVCEQWVPGLGSTTICVDCKHTKSSAKNSVSNQDVQDFVSMFHSYKDKNRWTAGVLVSNRPFSQQANAVASQHHDIHLKTVDGLYEELLRIRAYLHHRVHLADDAAWFADYVPLNARLLDEELARTSHLNTLRAVVESWLKKENSRQLCLLGDFGSGKTTFLRRSLYTLAKQYLTEQSGLIPLFIPLREYYDAPNSKEIVERFFAKECNAQIRSESFFEMLRSGRFLLLLDGFDEMGAGSTAEVRKANYLKLAPLVSGGRKAIITCRPAYFPAAAELVSVFSNYNVQVGIKSPSSSKHPLTKAAAQAIDQLDPKQSARRLSTLFADVRDVFHSSTLVELQLFDKRQVTRYLRQYDAQIKQDSGGHMDSIKLRETIKKTYDLEDLAHRPILLKLIVSTIPKIPRLSGEYVVPFGGRTLTLSQITPAVLYHLYTENELRREEEERGFVYRVLTRTRKTELICALANAMLEQGVLVLAGEEFQDVIRRLAASSGTEAESMASEIRTCSFLQRDHHDCLRFTHKSFLEYYGALYICQKLRNVVMVRKLLGRHILENEVAFFLGDLIGSLFASRIVNVRGAISATTTKESAICTENCLALLNNARIPFPELRRIACKTVVYKKLNIASLDLYDCNIAQLHFETTKVAHLRLFGTKLGSLVIQESDLMDVKLQQTVIQQLSGQARKLGALDSSDSDIGITADSALRFEAVRAANTTWQPIQNVSGPLPTLCKGNFDNCVFYKMVLSKDRLFRSAFSNCTFILCMIREDVEIAPAVFGNCRGVIVRERSGGIVVLGGKLEGWPPSRVKELSASHAEYKRWHEILIRAFVDSGSRSGRDIRTRLRAVDIASKLIPWRGKEVEITQHLSLAGGTAKGKISKVRLASCSAEQIEIVHLAADGTTQSQGHTLPMESVELLREGSGDEILPLIRQPSQSENRIR